MIDIAIAAFVSLVFLFAFGLFVGAQTRAGADRDRKRHRDDVIERCAENAQLGIGRPIGMCDGVLVSVERDEDRITLLTLPEFTPLRRSHA